LCFLRLWQLPEYDDGNRLNHVESCKYYLFKENEINFKKVAAQAQAEFKFTIPMETEQFWGIATSEIINPLIETTSSFLIDHIGLEINFTECLNASRPEKYFFTRLQPLSP